MPNSRVEFGIFIFIWAAFYEFLLNFKSSYQFLLNSASSKPSFLSKAHLIFHSLVNISR